MRIFYYVAFFIAIALQFVFVPLFLRAGWPQRSRKSTIYKCTCSVLFILTAAVAALINPAGFGTYAALMLAGFILSLSGDFWLDLERTDRNFLLGLSSFLLAHVCYMTAYIATGKKLTGTFFAWQELVAIAVLYVLVFVLQMILKLKLEKMTVPVAAYTLVILTMLVKAVSLGAAYVRDGFEQGWPILVVLTLGAILFVTSDVILAFMMFGGKNTKIARIFNIATYFSGQVFLAASLLWIA